VGVADVVASDGVRVDGPSGSCAGWPAWSCVPVITVCDAKCGNLSISCVVAIGCTCSRDNKVIKHCPQPVVIGCEACNSVFACCSAAFAGSP